MRVERPAWEIQRVVRKTQGGTSLVAQCLRLRAPNAGGWGSRFLVGELDPTRMLQLRPGAAK